MLRDRFGFRGELRAIGDVLIDEVPFMLRCGFDSFEVSNPPTLSALQAGHPPGPRRSRARAPAKIAMTNCAESGQ